MALDRNDPKYPLFKPDDTGEAHLENPDEGIKSNVKGYEHPYFSANGVISMINLARNLANSKEEQLSGEIPDKVFADIAEASKKTKVPYDFLLFACDWETKMTDRSSASDASGIAQKLVSYIPELRSSLGRDPMNGEIFAAHVLGSSSKVKELYQKAQDQPEEEVKQVGTKNDQYLINKKRGDKEQKRTNRELYDFFMKRVAVGKGYFKLDLGKDKYSS